MTSRSSKNYTSDDLHAIQQVVQDASADKAMLENAIREAIDFAKLHADNAEVAVTKSTGISVSTRFGETENIEFNSDGALGITVYCGMRKGSASSTDLRPEAIRKTVQAAIDIARYTSEDPCAGMAEKHLLAFDAPDLDLFHPWTLNTEKALALAAEAEETARNASTKIINTEGGSCTSHYGIKVYGNTHGMLQSYCSSRHSISSSVLAEEDGQMERDYAYTISRKFDGLQSASWVGAECAKRTLARLGPRKINTQKVPVIFEAEAAVGLMAHLVGAISGSSVYRKSTFLLDALGKQIMPEWLSIKEYPHLLQGLASSPFDSEGVRTSNRTIIDNGILQNWLLSTYSARKLGLESTGHAGGIHNWRVESKKETQPSLSDLIKQMNKGLLVTDLMGQGVNGVTGDYSRGASGFWIENGEIQFPVSEITIAGNLNEMWQQIIDVGSDTETRTNIQTGSILIENMQIAGN